jgi:hypothetical protein
MHGYINQQKIAAAIDRTHKDATTKTHIGLLLMLL